MSFHLLAAPLKSTAEVDLVKPLNSYIQSVYNTSEDDKSEIAEAVQELNKLRTKACCQPLDKSQQGLDVLLRLNRAALSLSDGSFERAAVLFNCGALMSQIAATQPMLTDEEIKTSAKLFQQSAGVFVKLRDSILGMVQQEPTPDLMPDTLAALSALMLAQAQETIYIKGHKDKMKPASLTKIAAQVADFYAEAHKSMTKDIVKSIWDKEWLNTVNGKTMLYQAVAQFHQSEVNGEAREIGEQLSRLTEAQRLTETALKYLPSSPYFTEQQNNINKGFTTAKKDNDFIYHERVADFRSLPALPKAALVKPTPVAHPMSPRYKDMFVSLVPIQVHNAMLSYDGRKAELVNIETGRLREHTQLMNGILASLNLPAALDDVTSTETLPESMKQKSAKLKQAGGYVEIQRMFTELPTLYKRNEEILDETNRVLTEEKNSDDNLRNQFAGKWNRMSSEQLTGPLVQEIGKYRGILHTASNADKMVHDKFEANRQGIELLSKNEMDLRNSIPNQQAHATGGASEAVTKLKELMNDVQQIKVEREKIEKDLKNVNCDIANDFLKAMTESQLINEEHISKEKINQLYGPLKQQVANSIKRQEEVLEEVQKWNNVFAREKSGTSSGAERERVLKTLATAADAFTELKANLDEGAKFYNDLTPILVRLQQKVSDFAFARQTEKEDLMRQLQQNIVSGGGSSNSGSSPGGSAGQAPRAPPPRPPPPSNSVEAPIPPPRMQQAIPGQVNFPPQAQQQQQEVPYPFSPYGQPQPFQPNFFPSQANPYPTYPGAFGAYSAFQQPPPNYSAFSGFPTNPQAPQAPQAPHPNTNNPFYQN
ncbi:hypothetical protein WR25_06845 [Diploscapter pachys]|uniref:BRO1 domain-containing protein n=1 Tax=Diploscapter pachys TaxID=2018661 RepID=A0A2A2L5C3_9BILA|nr:hypothetical protein WR25_06845 [Diploscapter pachys]